MAYLTLNGNPVEEARIVLPLQGVWFAEVVVQGYAPADEVLLVMDDVVSFNATTRVGGDFMDSTSMMLVGGAGGFADLVSPQHFRNTPLRIPLEQALEDVGERLSPASTEAKLSTELVHWVTRRAPAGIAVANLAAAVDGTWRVLADGRTWVGEETWPEVSVGFQLERARPGSDRVSLILEAPVLFPGFTFQGRKLGEVTYLVNSERVACEVAFLP